MLKFVCETLEVFYIAAASVLDIHSYLNSKNTILCRNDPNSISWVIIVTNDCRYLELNEVSLKC